MHRVQRARGAVPRPLKLLVRSHGIRSVVTSGAVPNGLLIKPIKSSSMLTSSRTHVVWGLKGRTAVSTSLLVCWIAAASTSSTAQAPPSGVAAVHGIAWESLTSGSPIPHSMPASQSNDPLEAGFARQWVQHALVPAESPERILALAIVSKRRASEDLWAQSMEKELRTIVHEKFDLRPTISRVFCNSVGCLCYLERDGAPMDEQSVLRELLGERGRKFGLQRSDVDVVRTDAGHGNPFVWELTLVRRPTPHAPTHTDAAP
jgi:hypothetical protein